MADRSQSKQTARFCAGVSCIQRRASSCGKLDIARDLGTERAESGADMDGGCLDDCAMGFDAVIQPGSSIKDDTPKIGDRFPKPIFKADIRLPAKLAGRQIDIGLPLPWVVARQRAKDEFRLALGKLQYTVG